MNSSVEWLNGQPRTRQYAVLTPYSSASWLRLSRTRLMAGSGCQERDPRIGVVIDQGLGQPVARVGHLCLDPLHVPDPVVLALAVVRVRVVARAPSEVSSLRVAVAWNRTVRNAVSVDVAVASPVSLERLNLCPGSAPSPGRDPNQDTRTSRKSRSSCRGRDQASRTPAPEVALPRRRPGR